MKHTSRALVLDSNLLQSPIRLEVANYPPHCQEVRPLFESRRNVGSALVGRVLFNRMRNIGEPNMNTSEILKKVEEKMNGAVHAYAGGNWTEPELRKCLIDDLAKATTEYLELRGRLFCGCGPALLQS